MAGEEAALGASGVHCGQKKREILQRREGGPVCGLWDTSVGLRAEKGRERGAEAGLDLGAGLGERVHSKLCRAPP